MRATNQNESIISQDRLAVTTERLQNMFDRYIVTKTELKDSTRNNYKYMYEHYIRDSFGQKKLASVKYSDVKAFYTSLIKDKGFKPNSMEIVHGTLGKTA